MTDQDVLFSELEGQGGHLGMVTLNRPNALNALSHGMIQAMHTTLQRWASAAHIKAVVIQAAPGRAFCAGGDLRYTYECKQTHTGKIDYFRDEYQLNSLIHHYPKPYIALLDGITMGGGVGISIHGSYRVATERLLFAMPETGIGFFPDVGGSYFLPRLTGYIGFYLGLIGARLSADDCVALGICQQKVASKHLPEILQMLAMTPNPSVPAIINQFAEPTSTSSLVLQQDEINHCFSKSTMEEIVAALQSAQYSICQQAAVEVLKKSPTSLKVTLRALQQGKRLDFDACMQQENCLARRFVLGHDFFEGIRAVLIDKDQTPKWQPKDLSSVTVEMVDKYFLPVPEDLLQ